MQSINNGHVSSVGNGYKSSHSKGGSLNEYRKCYCKLPTTGGGDSSSCCINDRLPKEMILKIFSFLDITTLCRCAQVCRFWYQLALDGSNWRVIDLFSFQKDIQGPVVEKIAQRCRGFLRELYLKGCQNVTDVAIQVFAKNCKNIEKLDLSECKRLTNETCRYLGDHCHSLEALDLCSCVHINDRGLENISRCHQLAQLDVSWCPITDEGLQNISIGCPKLERLWCKGCRHVTSRGIALVAQACSNLTLINFNYCGAGVTDEALVQLAKGCSGLRTVCMSSCGITDNGIRILSQACKDLQNIEVAQCSQLTDAAFLALAKNCAKLEKMDLEDCSQITNATLSHLAINCPSLQNLSLSHCEQITDDGIRELAYGLCAVESLRILELDNCPLITDAALEHLVNCKELRKIELYDCQLITRNGIRKLQSRLPDLEVHAYFAPVTPPGSTREGRRRFCRCCILL